MKMMMMLLLLSAVALFATTAYPSTLTPKLHLEVLFDAVEQLNGSFSTVDFVDDVTHLMIDQGCEMPFFCKVHHLLHNNSDFKESREKAIMGNLNQHIKNTTCKDLLKKVTPATHQITISKLMDHLTTCIRRALLRAGKVIKA